MSPLQFLRSPRLTSDYKQGDMDMMDRSGRVLTGLAVASLLTSLFIIALSPLGYAPVIMERSYCSGSSSSFNTSSFLFSRSAIETDYWGAPDTSSAPPAIQPTTAPSQTPPPLPSSPLPVPLTAPPAPSSDSDSDSDSVPDPLPEPAVPQSPVPFPPQGTGSNPDSGNSPESRANESSDKSAETPSSGWPVYPWADKQGEVVKPQGGESLSASNHSSTIGCNEDNQSVPKKKMSALNDASASRVEAALKCEERDTKCVTCAAVRSRIVLLKVIGAVSLVLCLATAGTALAAAMSIMCICCRNGFHRRGNHVRALSISSAVMGACVFITHLAVILALVNVIVTKAQSAIPPQISKLLLTTFAPAALVVTVHVGVLSGLAHWMQRMVREPPPNAPHVGPVLAVVRIV